MEDKNVKTRRSFRSKRHEIIGWIEECKNLDSLYRIRAKLNKRIKKLVRKPLYNPLDSVDKEKKIKILSRLFYESNKKTKENE